MGGALRAGAALPGTGGQENHFSPHFPLLGFSSPQHTQGAGFWQALLWGTLIPTPVSSRERCRNMGQRYKSRCSTWSGGDSAGVPPAVGTQSFAPLPCEPQQHPLMCFKPQQHIKYPMAQPLPSPIGCQGTGTPCCPPWAVMSSSTRNSSVQDYFPSPFGLLFQGTGLIHRKNMKFRLRAAKMGPISTNQHFKRAWACVCSWEADEMIWGFEAVSLETLLSSRERDHLFS